MPMDPKEKSTWIKVGVIFVLFLAVIIGFPGAGLYFSVAKLQKTSSELAESEKVLEEAKKKGEDLPAMQKRIEEMDSVIKLYEQRLPDNPDAPELFELLKSLGLESGIEFVKMERQKTKEMDLYTEIPMELEFVGDYHSMGTFISRIEGSDRFAKVDRLSITLNNEDDANYVPGIDPFYRQRCRISLSTFMFNKGKAESGEDKEAQGATAPKGAKESKEAGK